MKIEDLNVERLIHAAIALPALVLHRIPESIVQDSHSNHTRPHKARSPYPVWPTFRNPATIDCPVPGTRTGYLFDRRLAIELI